MTTASSIALVQEQLDAFNAKDVDALLRTYSDDAEHWLLGGECLARGHDELRARFVERSANRISTLVCFLARCSARRSSTTS
jgi:putative hydrolase of HD superfamily